MSGKGSKPRPYSVDNKTFGDNWDRIFSKRCSVCGEVLPSTPVCASVRDQADRCPLRMTTEEQNNVGDRFTQ